LPVFLEKSESGPAYRKILEELNFYEASFAGLSGAGSCCFGIFNTEKNAKNAKKSLFNKGNFVSLTFFLAHKPHPVVKY
jgi:4-diphosphocytidyl-2C-methyl-D-erythritol kinase